MLELPAAVALAAGSFVNVFTSGGVAQLRPANATDDSKPADGFVAYACAAGSTAYVFGCGALNDKLSGLTPGATYFLSTTDGEISTAVLSDSGNSVQIVGKAVSASALIFAPQAIGTSLTIGFILNSGATGTSVAPRQVAPRSGLITKCKVVTNASDGSTDLTFRIRQNGTDVFSSDPTVTHGAAAGTLSTFTTLTSSPLSVAADDVFSIDVTSGTASWQVTIQLE